MRNEEEIYQVLVPVVLDIWLMGVMIISTVRNVTMAIIVATVSTRNVTMVVGIMSV